MLLFLSGQERQGTYGQRALNCLWWGSTSPLKCHQSQWTCQHSGPSEDMCCLCMGNTFPVKTRTWWGVKNDLTPWLRVFSCQWTARGKVTAIKDFSPYTPLKWCRLPPYKYDSEFALELHRLTAWPSTMAAGITLESVYEENDKEVLSSLNRDIVTWGHSWLLWSGHVSKAGINCH